VNQIDTKILTVEDPVEYELEGIIQVPANEGIGLTFARALRAFLRQDPDKILVGETRDLETAQIAIQASLTGHLVMTSLHTNDAAGAVTRLLERGPSGIEGGCAALGTALAMHGVAAVMAEVENRWQYGTGHDLGQVD
jgi:type II secretory ATPase GspE/PulE/Tfp pilus assembly ATPase PilB-like protein